MAITSWIDDLATMWAEMSTPTTRVETFKLVGKDEFPDVLTLEPGVVMALTFPPKIDIDYSMGGPSLEFFHGVTELHVMSSGNRKYLPSLMKWIEPIKRVAKAHLTLHGKVNWFVLTQEDGHSIEPAVLNYGTEDAPQWHLGLIIRWKVHEDTSGDYPIEL